MTTVASPRDRAAPVLLWGAAGALVLAAHAGLVAWSLRQPSRIAGEPAAQQAVMIDLAPEPAPEIMPEPVQTLAPDIAPPVPDPTEPLPEPMADLPEPIDTPPPPDAPPEVEPPALPPSDIAEPRPPARPRIVETPKPKPTTKPKPVAQAKPPAAQPPQAASKPSTSGARGAVSPTKWQSRLVAHIEKRKRYPAGARGRGEQGTVQVRFRIDANGYVLSVVLARSSGFPDLDKAVLDLIHRASPVPPPPEDAPREVTAPVSFKIR